MLINIRKHKLFEPLWKALCVLFINICVDAADPNPQYIPENLEINDQESIIELIFENVLGYENFIQEYDDEDQKKTSISNNNLNYFWAIDNISTETIYAQKLKKQKFCLPDKNTSSGYSYDEGPPPRYC
jgi:hypothetical protein